MIAAESGKKAPAMIFFITFLRALAACFITNAHYTGIYPTDLIANGGLLGDVLFFAVSGYCLYNVKYDLSARGFAGWYSKRILRVYPPVWMTTALFMLLGAYEINGEKGFIGWYVFPTYYHFVASIIILYIPFFFMMKIPSLRERIPLTMGIIGLAWLAVYWLAYDRTYYHIDAVREPMIRFLFIESMLLGAWFRQNDRTFRNRFHAVYPVAAAVAFGVFFFGKLLFSRRASLAPLQFLNQIAIFALLFFLFRTFCGLDEKLEKMPGWLKRMVQFLSEMTLEIYVVQYVIIDLIRDWGLFFPLNWIVLTASILCAAFILHKICGWVYTGIDKALVDRKA